LPDSGEIQIDGVHLHAYLRRCLAGNIVEWRGVSPPREGGVRPVSPPILHRSPSSTHCGWVRACDNLPRHPAPLLPRALTQPSPCVGPHPCCPPVEGEGGGIGEGGG